MKNLYLYHNLHQLTNSSNNHLLKTRIFTDIDGDSSQGEG